MNKTAAGHIAALVTVIIWGTTFISTKILLEAFGPTEILFIRFLLGFAILSLIYPKRLKTEDKKQELIFAAAGLCGICLYYLLENIALTYTTASNVSVIISAAPFFTAVLSRVFMKTEKQGINFFIGFVTAMTGICIISFGGIRLGTGIAGDMLALLAALIWAVYSLLTRKIGSYGYNTVQATRRIFAYGMVFMIPALFFFPPDWDTENFFRPEYLMQLVYLGAGASALCFVSWNYAVKVLGAVRTGVYIYTVPVITVITSAAVLKERLTVMTAAGTLLTLAGSVISEMKPRNTKGEK